jgi:hypothetical protein
MARTYLPPIYIFPLCATRAQRRISCTDPPSLNLGTKWRWVVNLPLHSRARTPVPTKQEAGLVPQPVSTLSKTEKSFNRVRNRTLDRPAYSLFTTMSHQRTDSVSKSAMTLKKRNIGHSSLEVRTPENIRFWPWWLPSISFQIHNSPATQYWRLHEVCIYHWYRPMDVEAM